MRFPAITRPAHRATRVLTAAVAVLVVAGLAVLVVNKLTGLPAGVVLRVNDTVVTEDELNSRIRAFETLYGVESPKGEKAEDFRRDSAKAVAVGIVLDEAARDRGIVVPDKVARDALTKMIEEQMGLSGRDGFVALLGKVGASEREVLDEIKRQRSTMSLLEEVTKDVEAPDDAGLREAFEARKDEMVTPESRKLRNIVVATEKEAKRVLKDARSGAGFADLVKQHSLDLSTRDDRGDLGFVRKDQLDPAYAEVAFNSPRRKPFGPVQTEFGWNVGLVAEIRAAEPLEYAEVKKELRDAVTSERQLKKWRDWLTAQLKRNDVEYADEYQPGDPDAPPRIPQVPGPKPEPPR